MLSERLRAALLASGKSQADLARACDVKPPSVNGWLSGKSKFLRGENLLRASKFLNVRPTWLAEGVGPMQPDASENPDDRNIRQPFDNNVRPVRVGKRAYPVISHIQAGGLTKNENPYAPGDGYDVEYGDDEWSEWTFVLEIEGDSMLPDFRSGDRVMIDPEISPGAGDFVAAKNDGKGATFKKYRARGLNTNGNPIFELVPLNPDYETLRSDVDELEIIGVMVEHRRKYKKKAH